MPGIFISYRRSDTEGYAGRLFEGLKARFGQDLVFFDVAGIAPGQNFHKVIDDRVRSCDVLLALIGNTWASSSDKTGQRRFDNPEDFVRLETAAALKRDVPVIPVLLQGAAMPRQDQLPDDLQGLARLNAMELRHTRWDSDLAQLLETLEKYVKPQARQKPARRRRWIAAVLTGMTLVISLTILLAWLARVEVPGVVGLPIEAAKAILDSQQLTYGITESDKTAAAALAPRVLDQQPPRGASVGRGTRVELVATRVARSVTPPSPSAARDAEFERAIVGTWRSMRTVLNGAFLDIQGTYHPGGRASWSGNLTYQRQRTPLVLSGTWQVNQGQFHTRVEASSAPGLLPNGLAGEAKILDITADEFAYVDRADGKTYVDIRMK